MPLPLLLLLAVVGLLLFLLGLSMSQRAEAKHGSTGAKDYWAALALIGLLMFVGAVVGVGAGFSS